MSVIKVYQTQASWLNINEEVYLVYNICIVFSRTILNYLYKLILG